MEKTVAIVLAAGKGTRMGTDIAKQYLTVNNKPLLYYTLKAFDDSLVDEIIVVVGNGEEDYCRKHVVDAYPFQKISKIVIGGKERYDSVYEGLKAIEECEYVLIHDGARPCLRPEMINKTIEEVKTKKACVVGVPVKDTIKVVENTGRIIDTPERAKLMITQTPQAFDYEMLCSAYEKLFLQEGINVTDDAMVVETMLHKEVYMVEGDYCNIKVTTPEDLVVVKQFLNR